LIEFKALDQSSYHQGQNRVNFNHFEFHESIQQNIDKLGFTECTPIQEIAIPKVLENKDISGLAQTGTGKTGAFLLPLIERVLRSKIDKLKFDESKTQDAENFKSEHHKYAFPEWNEKSFILVLVPTRELADQIYQNFLTFAEGTELKACSIYGGVPHDKQIAALKSGVQFIIATPGRLIDLFKVHHIDLSQIVAMVFDEADRMFDMGFKDDVSYILRRVPKTRQYLLFSATDNFDVMNMAYEFGAQPEEINISKDETKAVNVADEILQVGDQEKAQFLISILKLKNPKQAIVFSNFKRNVERLGPFLTSNGFKAEGISSLLSQSQRSRIMERFKDEGNETTILVATDVAARGLDIKNVDLVINYELPDDASSYVHRIGRTGRAGEKGEAISLVSDKDVESLARIHEFLGYKLDIGWVEDKDLITDFKPLPRYSNSDRFNKTHSQRGKSGNPHSNPYPKRNSDKDRRPKKKYGEKDSDGNSKPDYKAKGSEKKYDKKYDKKPRHKREDASKQDGNKPGYKKTAKPQHQVKKKVTKKRNTRTRSSRSGSVGTTAKPPASLAQKFTSLLKGLLGG
jgi:superfamily II DNA/RNA helicase